MSLVDPELLQGSLAARLEGRDGLCFRACLWISSASIGVPGSVLTGHGQGHPYRLLNA